MPGATADSQPMKLAPNFNFKVMIMAVESCGAEFPGSATIKGKGN